VGALDRVQERLMRRLYGAGTGHLLMMLVCLAGAAGAVALVADDPAWRVMLVWFLAAVVVHDLVLFPLYTGADRALGTVTRRRPPLGVPLVNHVRIPLLGAGLTFLMFLPGIIRQGEPFVLGASGLDQSPFLGRWLLLVAAMALVSALVYAVRVLRRRSPDGEQQVVHGQREQRLGGEPVPDLPPRQ
jgi:membrane protein implicated in regulation of membrane protease activity